MRTLEGKLIAEGLKFALVVSRFNSFITERLLEGALDCLRRKGVAEEHLTMVRVPGAWEIPLAAKRLAQVGAYDAIICLGAVIRGSTPHFDYVAAEVSKGIAQVSLEAACPSPLASSPPTAWNRPSNGPAARRAIKALPRPKPRSRWSTS